MLWLSGAAKFLALLGAHSTALRHHWVWGLPFTVAQLLLPQLIGALKQTHGDATPGY